MKLLLITGVPSHLTKSLVIYLTTKIPQSSYSDLQACKKSLLTKPQPWTFTDHYEITKNIITSWVDPPLEETYPQDWLFVSSPTRDYTQAPKFYPPCWFPVQPKSFSALIHQETTPVYVSRSFRVTEEVASEMIIKERLESDRYANSCGIPFFSFSIPDPDTLDFGYHWLNEIQPFFQSLENSPSLNPSVLSFSQEIQLSVKSADEESQLELKALAATVVTDSRVKVSWDTWRGIVLTASDLDYPWTEIEFRQLTSLIQFHPNVLEIDVTNSNITGQERSAR